MKHFIANLKDPPKPKPKGKAKARANAAWSLLVAIYTCGVFAIAFWLAGSMCLNEGVFQSFTLVSFSTG